MAALLLLLAALGWSMDPLPVDITEAAAFKSYSEGSRRRSEERPVVAGRARSAAPRLSPARPHFRARSVPPSPFARSWTPVSPEPPQYGFLVLGAVTLVVCAAAAAPLLARPGAPPPLRRPPPLLLPDPEPRRVFDYAEDAPWAPPPAGGPQPSWRAITAEEQALIEAWLAGPDCSLEDWLARRGQTVLLAKLGFPSRHA